MRRQVGEHVFDSIGGQAWRKVRGHAAGPAADLQHTQGPTLRQLLHHDAQDVLDQNVVKAIDNPILVELLGVTE